MNKLSDVAPVNGSGKIEGSLHLVNLLGVGQETEEARVLRLYKSPGGPLVAWLFDEAKGRGQNQKAIAAELGITYGYLSQLQNGTRNPADIGQSIVDACAKYLGVPGVVVKLISGNIKISEFVLPYQNEEQVIDRAIRKVQGDPQIRAVLPDDLLSLPLSAKKAIEMSLRLPLLHAKGFDIRKAWDPAGTGVPLLSNDLLIKASDIGLPIKFLRYGRDPEESIFLTNLHSEQHGKRANIVRLRNNICHGNLSIFVEEKDGIALVRNSEIEKEAKELEAVVTGWSKGFGEWHTIAEKK